MTTDLRKPVFGVTITLATVNLKFNLLQNQLDYRGFTPSSPPAAELAFTGRADSDKSPPNYPVGKLLASINESNVYPSAPNRTSVEPG